jgi:hypothetical protein
MASGLTWKKASVQVRVVASSWAQTIISNALSLEEGF